MLGNTLLVVETLNKLVGCKHSHAELIEKYFREVFDYTLDLSNITFPEKIGFPVYMAVPQDISEDEIAKRIAAYFKVGLGTYSSSVTSSVKRDFEQIRPQGLYVFVHRGGDEPEFEYRNKSYDDVAELGVLFLNIKEYLLVTGFHRWTKGYFMDIKGWTRTSSFQSSRYMFRGCWNKESDQLCLYRSRSGRRYPSNGLRELFLD